MKKISSRFRMLRGHDSQSEAAAVVGITQQGWARYEKGHALPGAEMIHQICCNFHVSADWLLGFTDSRTGTAAPATDAATLAKIAALEAEIAAIRAEKDAEIARLNGVIEGLRLAFTATGKGK